MESGDESEKCVQLGRWVGEAGYIVWFTGAGISTESGIPDYRGPEGVWTRRDAGLPPPKARVPTNQAQPNRTHLALVELEKRGKAQFLISQNVDGLHLASGFPGEKLAELHGNSRLMLCSKCTRKLSLQEAGWDRERWGPGYRGREEVAGQPACPYCNGRLYSTVVNFGDNLPVEDLEASFRHAQHCDLFVTLGSSLVVTPAADLPREAQMAGARLAISNLGATPYDGLCDLRISTNVGEVMDSVLQTLDGQSPI